MAQSVLDLILRTKKQGTGEKDATSGLRGLSSALGSTLGVTLGVTAAVGALAAGFKFVVSSAAEAQVVQAQLGAVLKSTGGAAGMSADEVNDLATRLSGLSGVEDETIIKAEAVLLTFTKVSEEVFPGATEAALNMSAALGIDLQGSIIQVGKALNDPIQGVTALRRVGVAFTKDQMDMIQALVDSNQTLEAQKLILGELETEFGGAAEAMGSTFTGNVNKLKVAFGNLGEAIGTRMLPGLTAAAGGFTLLVDAVTELIKVDEEAKDSVFALANEMTGLVVAHAHNTGAVKENGLMVGIFAESEWKAQLAAKAMNMSLAAQTEALDEAQTAQDEYQAGMSALNELIGGRLGPEVEDYKNGQQDLAERMADVNVEIDKMLSMGYSETSNKVQGLRDEYGNLADEYVANADEHRDATNRIIFDIARQQLALSGLTPELQLDALEDLAKQLGIVDTSTESATVATQALVSSVNADNADNLADAMAYIAQATQDGVVSAEELKKALDILNGTLVIITYQYDTVGEVKGGGNYEGFAEGGDFVVNRPTVFLAGEAGPERVTVTPEGETGFGGATISVVQNFYGATSPEAVRQAASAGVLEAARQMGAR